MALALLPRSSRTRWVRAAALLKEDGTSPTTQPRKPSSAPPPRNGNTPALRMPGWQKMPKSTLRAGTLLEDLDHSGGRVGRAGSA